MNIRRQDAGMVGTKHITKRGFKVYEVIDAMGEASLPQYKKGNAKINGGWWTYIVKIDDEEVWSGWWNTEEEFDETMAELGIDIEL